MVNHELGGRRSYAAQSRRQAIDMYAKDVLPVVKPVGVYSLGYVGLRLLGLSMDLTTTFSGDGQMSQCRYTKLKYIIMMVKCILSQVNVISNLQMF